MFRTDGFARLSQQDFQKEATSKALTKSSSEPILPRLQKVARKGHHKSTGNLAGSAAAAAAAVSEAVASTTRSRPPGAKRANRQAFFNVTEQRRLSVEIDKDFGNAINSVSASISEIRSSVDQFQGCKSSEADAPVVKRSEAEQDAEDLRERLMHYRYARRLESPPPPLSSDPLFEDIPPAPSRAGNPRIVSSTQLKGFLPSRRRTKIAEEAELRKQKLAAAKNRRESAQQESTERNVAELQRHAQRMQLLDKERQLRRQSLNSRISEEDPKLKAKELTRNEKQERQQQLLQALACAAFAQHCSEVLASYRPVHEAAAKQMDSVAIRLGGDRASDLSQAAAGFFLRWQFSEIAQTRLAAKMLRTPGQKKPWTVKHQDTDEENKIDKLAVVPFCQNQQTLPLEDEEAVRLQAQCSMVQQGLLRRVYIRRARKNATCILAALRGWWPARAMRMFRRYAACAKRLQRFIRSSVRRLKAVRVMVEKQMLVLERDIIQQELRGLEPRFGSAEADSTKMRAGSKNSATLQQNQNSNTADSGILIAEEDISAKLLPASWRRQTAMSELVARRRGLLSELDTWRYDMGTYAWEVSEYRRGAIKSCPKMPPYPTHVPPAKELFQIVLAARADPQAAKDSVQRHVLRRENRAAFFARNPSESGLLTISGMMSGTVYAEGAPLIEEVKQVMQPVLSPRGSMKQPEENLIV
eukprot:TRINITY_DN79830_c0_g1_i1.p1 TRINITY_DN79830_c0_g1~~TRINITY_DN79830_c0_g1_i1.p1  ORF type:complete len:699 (-),score=143.61 TRINITY_DN79830_c0_g1_i1:19-2115(-)